MSMFITFRSKWELFRKKKWTKSRFESHDFRISSKTLLNLYKFLSSTEKQALLEMIEIQLCENSILRGKQLSIVNSE